MSNDLAQLTTILTTSNYQEWSGNMKSFLQCKGLWKCVKPGALRPEVKMEKKTEVKTDDEGKEKSFYYYVAINQSDVDAWVEDEEKAMGSIRLCLSANIAQQHESLECPALLWEQLKQKYGRPGLP